VLSPDAQTLADQLVDDDHIAMVPMPAAELAAEHGMSAELYVRHRAEIYASVGAAISELRREGWALAVRHVRGAEIHEGAERVIIVEAEVIPERASRGAERRPTDL
jgi:hypothetical protein